MTIDTRTGPSGWRKTLVAGPKAASSGVGLAVGAAVVLSPFVFLGVVNGDEGWYTGSSRLAAHGLLPYRDFAFTQGPIYLYLLAPFERLFPGLITSRILSALCAAVGISLVLVVAGRLAGKRAILYSAAVLLAATPSLPYWLALTKTYGVASLFLSATLYALTSPASSSWRLPIAVVSALGFAFSRPSAALFAVAIFGAAVWTARSLRSRITITVAAVAVSIPFIALVALAPASAIWDLVSYHQLDPRPSTTPWAKLLGRSIQVIRAWPGPTLLVVLAVVALAASAELSGGLRSRPDLIAFVGGLASFLILHELGAWFWAEEYVVPAIPSVVVVATSILVLSREQLPPKRREPQIFKRRPGQTKQVFERWHITAAVVVCIGVTAATGGHRGYIGTPGWIGSPGADQQLARCIDQNSSPNDRVFALFLSDLVTEADRLPITRASLGLFSYQDVSAQRARELHILDRSALLDLLTVQQPKVVVLSGLDTLSFGVAGYFSRNQIDPNPYVTAITDNYREVCERNLTRGTPNITMQVEVFVRKP